MSLVWEGLEELKAALRQMPAELGSEAGDVVEHATDVAETALRQAYPLGDTGNLRAGVSSTVQRSAFGAVGTVISKSAHAHLWEFGTQNRVTRQGWRRGISPAHKDGLVPIAVRERKKMYGALMAVLQRAGFEVSGTP